VTFSATGAAIVAPLNAKNKPAAIPDNFLIGHSLC
jgi:hypothetical protein